MSELCSDLNYLHIHQLLAFLVSLDYRFSGDEVDEVCGVISNTDHNYSYYLLFEFKIKEHERACWPPLDLVSTPAVN